MPGELTRLQYLYTRFLDDTATPEEVMEFWRLFPDAAGDDPVMGSIFDSYNNRITGSAKVDWQRMLDRILPAAGVSPGVLDDTALTNDTRLENDTVVVRNAPPSDDAPATNDLPPVYITPRTNRRMLYYRLLAAAVFLLLIGAAWWYRHGQSVEPPVVIAPADLPPGHNGAILTLGQGQQVVLDSAANGAIAQQGNTDITKRNGALAYRSSGLPTPDVFYNTLTIPRGRQFQLVLPDSTKVWLNAASSLRFPTAFTGAVREVMLTGEAYFEVAPNAHQPFRVRIDSQVVEVLGTSFNVNGYEDEAGIRTTLLQGSIQVALKGGTPVRLRPGEQAAYFDGAAAGSTATTGTGQSAAAHWQLSKIDPEKVIAWKEGWFRFDGNSVPVIMRQLSRWYDVDVLYEAPPPRTLIGGEIPRDMPLSKALDVLRMSGVNLTYKEGKIIVKP